jgi:hypothetical protein
MITDGKEMESEKLSDTLKQCLDWCKECGKKIEQGYSLTNRLCFSCDFWTKLCQPKEGCIQIIVDGHHYQTGYADVNCPDAPRFAGFGGRQFYVKLLKEIPRVPFIFFTHNMWHQGTIPIRFRDRLPDNAEFINKVEVVDVNGTECFNIERI